MYKLTILHDSPNCLTKKRKRIKYMHAVTNNKIRFTPTYAWKLIAITKMLTSIITNSKNTSK